MGRKTVSGTWPCRQCSKFQGFGTGASQGWSAQVMTQSNWRLVCRGQYKLTVIFSISIVFCSRAIWISCACDATWVPVMTIRTPLFCLQCNTLPRIKNMEQVKPGPCNIKFDLQSNAKISNLALIVSYHALFSSLTLN